MSTRFAIRALSLTAGFLLAQGLSAQHLDYPVTPVPFTQVHLTDGFWQKRLEVNRSVTIPYAFAMCEKTGRVNNFAIAGDFREGEQCGIYPFDDSDVYKVIEGASYSLAVHQDPELESYLDHLIDTIRAAQEKDGYLYTARTNHAIKLVGATGPERWSNLAWSHELYDAGHLYEAAAAFYEATGKRSLLDVALRNAQLLLRTFGPDGRHDPPGHEEVEIGLAKLYRVTGDARYINLARFFLEQRGRPTGGRKLYGEYAQDHVPVLQQTEAVGHAVRELYMLSGMADVAALTGDPAYAKAVDAIWGDIVAGKIYVTGGVGATGMWEGFGPAYDLPNLSAYCETCASIANVLANYRLFLLHGDGKYMDVLERTLYNALLSGVSMSGDRFFYPNVLASRGQTERSPWFQCACCPSNMTRFIPSIPGYVYARRGDSLYLNLYAANTSTIKVKGVTVDLAEATRYPWDGAVRVTLTPKRPVAFPVLLRIPGWARNDAMPADLYRFLDASNEQVSLKVNGIPQEYTVHQGYASVSRTWSTGDVIELTLPMPVRRILANEKVAVDVGRVALQRGPIMFCAEWPDNPGGHVLNTYLPDTATLAASFHSDLLNGVEVVTADAFGTRYDDLSDRVVSDKHTFTLIPYYAWSHRGPGEMEVWIGRGPSATETLNGASLAAGARVASSGGMVVGSLARPGAPVSSADTSGGRFAWTGSGDTVWIQYEFSSPQEISEAQVYWYDDGRTYQAPVSWRILSRFEGRWVPVYNPSRVWGVALNQFNQATFETVRTETLRLQAILRKGSRAGILAWRVN